MAKILSGGERHERIGKLRRSRARVGRTIRRVCAHDANRERFNRGIENSVARADARLAGSAENFGKQAVTRRAGRVRQADARSKIAISRRRQRARDSWVARIDNACRRIRENDRLLIWHERRDLIVFLIPGLNAIPAQAVVKREIARQPPTVLGEEADIFVASVKSLQLALVVLAGRSQKKVREIGAGFRSKEKKAAIELRDSVDVDLIVVKFTACFDRVPSNHFGKIVEPLIGISNLVEFIRVRANREAVEGDALDAFCFWRERQDSVKPCEAKLTPTPPIGLPKSTALRR